MAAELFETAFSAPSSMRNFELNSPSVIDIHDDVRRKQRVIVDKFTRLGYAVVDSGGNLAELAGTFNDTLELAGVGQAAARGEEVYQRDAFKTYADVLTKAVDYWFENGHIDRADFVAEYSEALGRTRSKVE